MTHDIAKKKTITPYVDGWVIIIASRFDWVSMNSILGGQFYLMIWTNVM